MNRKNIFQKHLMAFIFIEVSVKTSENINPLYDLLIYLQTLFVTMCSAPFGKAAWLSSVQCLARSHCFDKIGHSAFIGCQKGLQQDLKLDLPAVCSRQWELMGLSHCPLTLTVFASARQGISMPESPFFFFKCLESSPCGHPDQPMALNRTHSQAN